MGPVTGVAIYLTIWWTVLFAILPLGNKTYAEMGMEPPGGGDPGAPVNPNLKRKFLTTTVVAAVLFSIVWVVTHFGLIRLSPLAASH